MLRLLRIPDTPLAGRRLSTPGHRDRRIFLIPAVHQQIVGLYLAEMLLKYALDHSGASHGQHHNLHELFRNLSRQRRRAVERQYTKILNSTMASALDVAETVESLLRYLGQNAITDTRYFWEPGPQPRRRARVDSVRARADQPADIRAVHRLAQLPEQTQQEAVRHDLSITCGVS